MLRRTPETPLKIGESWLSTSTSVGLGRAGGEHQALAVGDGDALAGAHHPVEQDLVAAGVAQLGPGIGLEAQGDAAPVGSGKGCSGRRGRSG
jgi:hypothetical protein